MVQLRAVEPDDKTKAYERLAPALDAPGLTTEAGGTVPFLYEANHQTERDLVRAETLSLPVLLVLLVVIFGGLVAAGLPLLVGGLAILGAFVAVRLLTLATDISVFAVNVITLIGLGMAIDYALFIVSRFREELAAGHETPAAIQRTMTTAGRTVMVSGLTIALALASLLIYPQVFLRSIGFGGMAAVLVAMLGALTVLPALLAVVGPRVNALRIPTPWRRREHVEGSGWARLARSVMRRPWLYAVGVVAILAVFAAPAARMQFGGFDERVLPAGTEPRVVAARLAAEFPGSTVGPIEVLVSGVPLAEAQRFAQEVGRVPGVTGVQLTASRGTRRCCPRRTPASPLATRPRRRCVRSATCPGRTAPRCWSPGVPPPTSTWSPASPPGCRGWPCSSPWPRWCCSSSRSARWCCRSRPY
ncbi:hypothetical protein Pflav_086610 [Phytohabitans flavus]|uniref:SSD domain-containing protein n=1 Tax=Phytohabitans flavus TaxID=1076124 RepID=A0A6F8Y8G6_9ACTN|nr:hypothetical protein Pflav_086610 [Phytohabitans flavus]